MVSHALYPRTQQTQSTPRVAHHIGRPLLQLAIYTMDSDVSDYDNVMECPKGSNISAVDTVALGRVYPEYAEKLCRKPLPPITMPSSTFDRRRGKNPPTRRKMGRKVAVSPIGYSCVNILVQRAVAKVINNAATRDRARKWAHDNPERNSLRASRWGEKNRIYKAETNKAIEKRDRQKIRDRKRQRCKTDPVWSAMARCRTRVKQAIKLRGTAQQDNTCRLLGCSPKELTLHLEQQISITESILLLQIDHVFPIASYSIGIPGQQACAMHVTNLQPLTATENRQKSSKLPTKAMAAKVDRDKWPPGVTEDMLPEIYPGWATPLRMHAAPTPGASSSTDVPTLPDDSDRNGFDCDSDSSDFDRMHAAPTPGASSSTNVTSLPDDSDSDSD